MGPPLRVRLGYLYTASTASSVSWRVTHTHIYASSNVPPLRTKVPGLRIPTNVPYRKRSTDPKVNEIGGHFWVLGEKPPQGRVRKTFVLVPAGFLSRSCSESVPWLTRLGT